MHLLWLPNCLTRWYISRRTHHLHLWWIKTVFSELYGGNYETICHRWLITSYNIEEVDAVFPTPTFPSTLVSIPDPDGQAHIQHQYMINIVCAYEVANILYDWGCLLLITVCSPCSRHDYIQSNLSTTIYLCGRMPRILKKMSKYL